MLSEDYSSDASTENTINLFLTSVEDSVYEEQINFIKKYFEIRNTEIEDKRNKRWLTMYMTLSYKPNYEINENNCYDIYLQIDDIMEISKKYNEKFGRDLLSYYYIEYSKEEKCFLCESYVSTRI